MNTLDLIGNTRIVKLQKTAPGNVDFFLKMESDNLTGSIKDRPAKEMVEGAIKRGELSPGQTLIEATSGNTGVSLAALSHIFDYRFLAVMPEGSTKERIDLLKTYGAKIIFSPKKEGSNGSIALTKDILSQNPDFVNLNQYANSDNASAHFKTTGPEIIKEISDITHFVAGLGTGGTLTGTGRFLKKEKSAVKIIAAEPRPEETVYGLRSLEKGFIPPVFDISVLDRKLLISLQDSITETQAILKNEGLLVGISTGTNIAAAKKIAKPGDVFVIISPDSGSRYLSTGLFDPGFIADSDDTVWW